MTARELANELMKHPDALVTVNVAYEKINEYYGIESGGANTHVAVDVDEISLGWLPSNVISIEVSDNVMSG